LLSLKQQAGGALSASAASFAVVGDANKSADEGTAILI
jgi:hypothetical protein